MSAFSKRKGIIVSVIIASVIWMSLNFILFKFQESQKKKDNSTIILKTSLTNDNKEHKQKTMENLYEENIKENIVENFEENIEDNFIENQYKVNEWRILIPKINLNAPIIEGTTKEVLRRGVGHFSNTSKWNGNVVLAAHNRGYKYNFFQEIKRLKQGDVIKYQTGQGVRTYEVMKNTIIKETDFSCLEETKENKLTLITCAENMPECRVCIQACQKF